MHRATTMWSRPPRWKTAWCAACSKAACSCSPCHPRIARHAEAELLHRFGTPGVLPAPLQRVNFDALLLAALRDQAKTAGVDWNVVLQADAADRGSRHWINLQRLVQRTLPALRSALLNSPAPVLLVSAGLLARYDLMGLITELEENAGRPGHTPSVWLLLPTSHQGLPVIDGVAVPMVNNIHNTRALALPQAWIENKHRAALIHDRDRRKSHHVIKAPQLLADLTRLLKRLEEDLLRRIDEVTELKASLQAEWQAARDADRTAETFETWVDQVITQAGVHWLLSCVFLRFIEDNKLVDRPWLGGTPESGNLALARDRHEAYFRANPLHSDRDYLLARFERPARCPGCTPSSTRATTRSSGSASAVMRPWPCGSSGSRWTRTPARWRTTSPTRPGTPASWATCTRT
jgi:hypothetical protein